MTVDFATLRRDLQREHAVALEALDRLEAAARALEEGDVSRRADLERHLAATHRWLGAHLGREDGLLPPALARADAWGRERATRLRTAHRELRDVLGFCRSSCAKAEPPGLLARRALDLIALLRAEIREEERIAVHPDVLRNDVVATDAFTG